MNTRSSSYTGRAHRDMKSAFGPYTDYTLEEQRADYSASWWAAMAICAILTLIYIGSTL